MPVTPLRLSQVSVAFGQTRILSDIDLELAQGTTLGILGPNGSGKSTLVRAALGIFPHTGTIELCGKKLGRSVPWEKIGYAPQRVTSTAGVPATALEVVTSGLLHGMSFRAGRGAKDKAMRVLEQVGLAHRANESVQTFSGGQQQRVLIARSLVRDPEILFLDEPFSGVDKVSREAITNVLAEHRSRGMTMAVVLHELQDLAPLIDETIVIEHGRIVHRGSAPVSAPGHDHPDHDHDHEHAAAPRPFRRPEMEGPDV